MDPVLKAGRVTAWLPEGIWFDVFTGLMYHGGRKINMYRNLKTIPVLAGAGAIIPLAGQSEVLKTANLASLELYVFAGGEGEHVMYEDDGTSREFERGRIVKTRYRLLWNDKKYFTIYPAEGELSLIPRVRNYQIKVYGVKADDLKLISVNGNSISSHCSYDEKRSILTIELGNIEAGEKAELWFKEDAGISVNQTVWRVFEILNRAQIEYHIKEKIYSLVKNYSSLQSLISSLTAIDTSKELKEMIQEIILA
jgi:hypothetical protein